MSALRQIARSYRNSFETATGAATIIGIGSPHADDAAGWAVIDELAQGVHQLECCASPDASEPLLLKAAVPHDILNWLDPEHPTHLIDASRDASPGVRRFRVHSRDGAVPEIVLEDESTDDPARVAWPDCCSSSTHQLDLLHVLQLAATLESLPRDLVLWTVSIESQSTGGSISQSARDRVQRCARRIAAELTCA